MSLQRSKLLARLKEAYESNNIPVDVRTQAFHKCLSSSCLLENAIYWETRAKGENPLRAIFTGEGMLSIRSLMPNPINGFDKHARLAIDCTRSADRQYHGDNYEE